MKYNTLPLLSCIQLLSSQGGSDPCLILKPDPNLVHPSFLIYPKIGCIIPNYYPPEYGLILGFSFNLKSDARMVVSRSDPRMIGS